MPPPLPRRTHRSTRPISILVWHHVEGWPEAVADAARVLRPGGWLRSLDLLHHFPPDHPSTGYAFMEPMGSNCLLPSSGYGMAFAHSSLKRPLRVPSEAFLWGTRPATGPRTAATAGQIPA